MSKVSAGHHVATTSATSVVVAVGMLALLV